MKHDGQQLMQNAALSLHGHNDNIIILFQTVELVVLLHYIWTRMHFCDAMVKKKSSTVCVTSGFYYLVLNKILQIIYQ